MLEIRNVTKVYHSKNGNSVTALDNISMTFPETGMVFVLGKSGSGKSTLLNVIGGLDGYDSGEFIIKGKSSTTFAGSDFDAYRNTFIGFIFQEYNILDEFTVGANIGLALELQGKKATNEKISEILAQVDMLDYAKRKPNELSGGQKQRIAIARALVKDPEIIMADEPTGALDSNTGKQIFDTLKELSKRKLVIIVSHDRDFAEKYGDRIIEMKDGQILTDVTKHSVEAKVVSSGILQMNDSLLRIEKGYQLTENDVKLINQYLKNQNAEILISGDSRVNDSVRSTAGISDDNTSSVFKQTNEAVDVQTKVYDAKTTRFIRSRLPMKNAFKMGSSGLGHKKFRLVMTIFLSLIAFALFGFADTLGAYDKIVAATDSIIDSNVDNASISLGVKRTWIYDDQSNSYYNSAAMNEDDIKSLSEKTGMSFVPVFNGTVEKGWGSSITMTHMMNSTEKISSDTAYTGTLYGFTAASASDISSLNFSILGRMPESKNEIAITKLVYDQFNAAGFVNNTYNEKVNAGQLSLDESGADNSIIGKHFSVNVNGMTHTFEICGVIDTRFDTQRYADYIPTDDKHQNQNQNDDAAIMDMIMVKELQNTLQYGFHGLGYVVQDTIDIMAQNMSNHFGTTSYIGIHLNNWNLRLKETSENGSSQAIIVDKYAGEMGDVIMGGSNELAYLSRVAQSSDIPSLEAVKWFDGRTGSTLSENEILIHESVLSDMITDIDVTQKVSDILMSKYGKPLDQSNGFVSLYEVLRSYEIELYVNDDAVFQSLKEDIAISYENMNGYPAENDEVLRQYFKERINSGDNIGDSVSSYDLEQRAVASFVSKFLNKEFNSEYNGEFYRSILNELFRGDIVSGLVMGVENIKRVIAIEYAYATVYANEAFYKNDDFMNIVVADRVGSGKLPEGTELTKEMAASLYSEYIMYSTNDDRMELFGEKRLDDFDSEAMQKYFDFTGTDMSSFAESVYIEKSTWNNDGTEDIEMLTQYRIAGTFGGSRDFGRSLVISDDLYNGYNAYVKEQGYGIEIVAPHEQGIYAFVIAPMPADRALIQKLVEMNYDETGDYQFSLQNQVIDSLDMFNNFIEMGAKIFLYVGIGFAVFAALMLMNFISVSISYKRREIGILRAVGARSSDVFKIFFCEAFIIAIINYVLSLVAAISATMVVNNLVRNQGINVTLLHFGVRQIILMLVISIAVAAIASFLPVWNIARRKPVDAIKNK